MATEQEKANLSADRGKVAAHISDPAEKRDYIAKQGNAEAAGKDKTTDLAQENFNKRNQLVVEGSMKKGGSVGKTGLYQLHEGEFVVPKDKVMNTDGLTGKSKGDKKLKLVSPSKGHKPDGAHGRAAVKALGRQKTTGNFAKIAKAKGKGAAINAYQNALSAHKAGK
jgi:hypothetical protein